MTADTMMLSPLPCKVLQSSPTSPYTPSEIDIQELSIARPFWYDVDEATKELRDVMTCQMASKSLLPDWMPAFEARSLSAASTCATSPPLRCATSPPLRCATSPPPHFSISESSSPDYTFVAPSDLDDGIESPTHDQQPLRPPGAIDKSSWLQARKVFVGGIPQTVDQNGLYQLFSKIGKVKKAWLQLFHNDRGGNQIPTAKKHRGFGFVIFYEKQSIDLMLGNESSRFVCFGNDLKLEVKRAFGKASATEEPPSTGKSQTTSQSPASQIMPQSPGLLWESQASNTSQSPASQVTSQSPACQIQRFSSQITSQSPASQIQRYGSSTTPFTSPAPQTCFRHPSQTWQQGFPSQPTVVVAFPCVPPFPFVDSRGVCNTQTLTAAPAPVEAPAAEAIMHHQPQCQFLPGVLFHQFVGQKPINSQELTQALLQAMPDHYED